MTQIIGIQKPKRTLIIQYDTGNGASIPCRYTEEDVKGILSGASKWARFEDEDKNVIYIDVHKITSWILAEPPKEQMIKPVKAVMVPPQGRKPS